MKAFDIGYIFNFMPGGAFLYICAAVILCIYLAGRAWHIRIQFRRQITADLRSKGMTPVAFQQGCLFGERGPFLETIKATYRLYHVSAQDSSGAIEQLTYDATFQRISGRIRSVAFFRKKADSDRESELVPIELRHPVG